jgi:putative hydrolase of HD superfamily
MAFMAMLVYPYLENKPDLERTLKMIVVHDLVEALVGDVPFFEARPRKEMKAKRELEAVEELRMTLPAPVGEEVAILFNEFEERKSAEALLVKALDTLEVQVQHNLADISTWLDVEHELVYTKMDRHCHYDPFLQQLCEAIKGEAEEKLIAAGVDVVGLKERVLRK